MTKTLFRQGLLFFQPFMAQQYACAIFFTRILKGDISMNMLNTAKKRFENAKREFQTAAIDLKSGKIPAPSKGDKILYTAVLS